MTYQNRNANYYLIHGGIKKNEGVDVFEISFTKEGSYAEPQMIEA